MNKKILIVIVLIILLGFVWILKKDKRADFSVAEIKRGDIVLEISEMGTIKKGEEINLGFNRSGKVEEVFIKVGQEVHKGDILIQLEKEGEFIQLKEVRAQLKLAKTKLEKLLIGPSQEEIEIAEKSVESAETFLESARQNLKNAKLQAEENLNNLYRSAIPVLDDAYLKIFNSSSFINDFQKDYFSGSSPESVQVRNARDILQTVEKDINTLLSAAKDSSNRENIDNVLKETKTGLEKTAKALADVRSAAENVNYKSLIPAAQRDILDAHRSYINSALSSIQTVINNISLAKISNEASVDSASGSVELAEKQLESARANLNQITSPPRREDIDLYNIQIEQAEAQVRLFEKQITDTVLKSPISGQIVRVDKKIGELAAAGETVISLISEDDFYVEVDIYEEDAARIDIGMPAEISFFIFPEKIFVGRVVFVNPVEKIIDGVVYYETTISLEDLKEDYSEKIKIGMTARVSIKTILKENVLIMPRDGIQRRNGRIFVEILKENFIREREIEIGARGIDDMIEVINGLEEGEKIIVY